MNRLLNRYGAALAALVMLLSACSAGADGPLDAELGSEGDAPAEVASTESSDETTSSSEFEPATLEMNALFDRVEAGEAEADVVLSALESMADGTLLPENASIITGWASEIEDPRVEELLATLLPTVDYLAANSELVGEISGDLGDDELVESLGGSDALGIRSNRQANCLGVDFGTGDDGDNEEIRCFIARQSTIESVVVTTYADQRLDADDQARFEDVSGPAIRRSLAVYSSWANERGGVIPPIHVMMRQAPQFDYSYAGLSRGECVIVINEELSGSIVAFTMAHEIFHCVQEVLGWSTHSTGNLWVIEGGAEWAALQVFPWPAAVKQGLTGSSLTGLGYSAWPVFQSLQEQRGQSAVFDFFSSGAANGGNRGRTNWQSLDPDGSVHHQFAQDAVTGNISFLAGAVGDTFGDILVGPDGGSTPVGGAIDNVEFVSAHMEFEPGYRYEIEAVGVLGSLHIDGGWIDLPASLDLPCGESDATLVLTGAAISNDPAISIVPTPIDVSCDADFEDLSDPADDAAGADEAGEQDLEACAQGVWQTDGSLAAWYAAATEATSPAIAGLTPEFVGGTMSLTVSGSRLDFELESLTLDTVVNGGTVTSSVSGTTGGNAAWADDMEFELVDSSLTATVTVSGTTINEPLQGSLVADLANPSCSGGTLTIEMGNGFYSGDVTFVRPA